MGWLHQNADVLTCFYAEIIVVFSRNELKPFVPLERRNVLDHFFLQIMIRYTFQNNLMVQAFIS